ncbi:MAG: serine/threonine-protein kinase [Planctomycetota bacterium]
MSIHHLDRPEAKASGHTTTILAPAASRERKCMALVPGSGLGYTDELHDLLRRRLRIVCLILLLGSGAFFARSLVAPTGIDDVQQQIIHAAVLLVLGTCTATLWSRMALGTPCLRRLELIAFGAVVGYFGYLQVRDFASHSILHDIPEAEQARVFQLATIGIAMRWFAVIALYGAFVPNTWRRCLAVVSVFTFVPMGLLIFVCFKCPVMGPLWPAAIFDMFVVLGIASAMTIFGSHRISELQQQAFEAKKLGQYLLKRKIGSGGMGDVYLAEHLLLRRACAVKTIKPDHMADQQTLARFEREVRAMATLTHWNSVEIYDYGHSPDGTFFYVMEYLPGMTLQEMIDRHGPLPAGRAIHFLRQVCAALKEAHGIGLIHRDIKPSNVLVCERGGVADVAKLLDFGLVQDISHRNGPDGDRLTMNGAILGSPPFISPEQARGNQPVDERTDIYGLGGLAYFLVTGRPPFERDSALEMMAAHLHEKPTPPSEVRAEVPRDLEETILRCLAKKPADRFADIGEVDRMLAQCEAVVDWSEDQADAWWKRSAKREPALA